MVTELGLALSFTNFELRYVGRLVLGTGRPGVASGADRARALDGTVSGGFDVVLAPESALTLRDATVFTNQFTVTVPIRN